MLDIVAGRERPRVMRVTGDTRVQPKFIYGGALVGPAGACVLALVALLLVPQLDRSGWYAAAGQPVYRESVLPGLHDGPRPIRNIYPYSRTGRPLRDVQLYDPDNGQPLAIGSDQVIDPLRRVLTAPGGRKLFNTFPIFYFEPNSNVVANPAATPAPIDAPRIDGPPPLRAKKRP